MDNNKSNYDTKSKENENLALDDDQRVKVLSPTQLVAKRFFRNRLAIVGLTFIIGMFLFSFVGGFLMPYGEDEVFTKYEEMYKVYAGITMNDDLKFVVAEDSEFSLIARSQLMLAIGEEQPVFEAEGNTFYTQNVGEDHSIIYQANEIGIAMSMKNNVNVTLGEGYSDSFAAKIEEAVESKKETVEIDGLIYLIVNGAKNSTIYELDDIALTTKNVYDFAEQGIKASFDFVKVVETALINGDSSVTVDGMTYNIETGDDLIIIQKDGKDYANVSRYQIEAIYDDVFFDLEFKETIRKAVNEGTEAFTYTNSEGEEESFRLYRQNLQWTLEHEESTYLVDEYSFPSREHLLGTDGNGMDILTRLMFGGRISLRIGFFVVIIETIIGIILGGIAGYFGKFWDNLIMRIVDIFNSIPSLPLIIILGAMMDQLRVDPGTRLNILMLVLALLGWPSIARMVRGQTLTLREQEFMAATEALGLPIRSRIFKHLIPNIVPQLIVICTLSLGGVILTESTLSFLGVGVKFPYASWGNIINAVSNVHVLSNYTFVWIPAGFCILITVLGFNFIGDGLRDAFDPKMKR